MSTIRKQKKRIAIFHNLPPGGAKRYIYEIGKRLSKKYSLDEYRLSSSSDYLPLTKISEHSKTYKYETGGNIFQFVFNSIFKLKKIQKEIAKDIDSIDYEYILVNHDFVTKSPHLLSLTTKKTIYFCHEPQREYYENQSLHSPELKDKISNLIRIPIKFIDFKNARNANALVANSRYSQGVLKRIYKKNSKIVSPGVDKTFFKPTGNIKKNYVVSVGGLLPVKGHEFVIESLSKIDQKNRPKLIIIGSGRESDVNRLRNLANTTGTKLKILSEVSDQKIVELYSSAYSLVCASYREPFGMSIIEAMSCQTPVVAIKSGGIGEQIINGKTGYLLNSRSKKNFSKKINLAIRNHKYLGRNARKYVSKNWSWEKSLMQLEKIFTMLNKEEKKKVTIVRGTFLNPFELQNFYPLAKKYDIRAISSLHPLSNKVSLPLIKLLSPTDLPNFPYKYQILNRVFTDAQYLLNLEKNITKSDIAHVAETYFHYTHQAILAKQKGLVKKIVSTVWEVIPHNNEGIRGRKNFKKLAYKHIDHFLAVTQKAKQALIEEGVKSSKITVIPMGVDINRFSHVDRKYSNEVVQILFIGRLTDEKGILELYQAFQKLRKENPMVRLVVLGKGSIKLPKTPGISFSTLPYSKIHKSYQKADIFCLPSKTTRYWQEQFGMVLVEAMASGLPIVTTKTGAIGEVCGDAAHYAKPGDANDLFKKLNRLVNDVSLRKKMGSLARKRAVKYYDSKKIAKKIDALYKKVLS